MTATITINLRDFMMAAAKIHNLNTPEHHCALCCVQMCGHWCDALGTNMMQLTFDQGERFCGHILDRMVSKRARKEEYLWDHVLGCGVADTRKTPMLQAADVLAWCVGQRHEVGVSRDWQRRLLSVHKGEFARYLTRKQLESPDHEALALLKKWKIQARKPFR